MTVDEKADRAKEERPMNRGSKRKGRTVLTSLDRSEKRVLGWGKGKTVVGEERDVNGPRKRKRVVA